MNHQFIDAENIVDRYLMHQLVTNEAEAFEIHYLGCQRCLRELEVSRDLQAGLKRTTRDRATQQGLPATDPTQKGGGNKDNSNWRWLAAASVIVAVASLAFSAISQRQLVLEKAERHRLTSELDAATTPEAATRLVTLERSRGLPDGESDYVLPATDAADWLQFSLDLGVAEFDHYSVSLHNSDGEVLWQANRLAVDDVPMLLLRFKRSRFKRGSYEFNVQGESGDRTLVPVASYSFATE